MRVENLTLWPPEYTIRHSARRQHPSLKISSHRGLEVIIPKSWTLEQINSLLTKKRYWIEKNADLLQEFAKKSLPLELPEHLNLACSGEFWKISYLYSPGKTQVVIRPHQELTVLGNVDDIQECLKILQGWLRQKAEQILTPKFYLLSQELSLPFKHLSIRNQKTRWGSCSSQKRINLNYKLIFLAPEIVRHIMVHELCHTVYLNHSHKFWQLVARFDQQWQTHHHLSRQVENSLPSWIDG